MLLSSLILRRLNKNGFRTNFLLQESIPIERLIKVLWLILTEHGAFKELFKVNNRLGFWKKKLK